MQTVKKDEKRRLKEDIAQKKTTERNATDSTVRRNVDSVNRKDKNKNETTNNGYKRLTKDNDSLRKADETNKKSIHTVSTPRNFIPKTTTADIYDKNKTLRLSKNVPSKISSAANLGKTTQRNKEIVKSTLTVPFNARKIPSKTDTVKPTRSIQKLETTQKTKKSLPINVTVNSPIQKRKLEQKLSIDGKDNVTIKERKQKVEIRNERQRTQTRTLDENEVKILTPEIVDNNTEMACLSKKLTAAPKAFYVNLSAEGEEKKHSSEEEVSYEDDFESYESDFEPYESTPSEASSESTQTEEDEVNVDEFEENSKEERMLDSGHFDLRDTRSANKTTPMDYITEASEEADKKTSLTDEGFQEMSSSSGLPSIKMVHVDVFERPLFIDFTKSKDYRKKLREFKRLKQRAQDILSIVALHEITYSLFEMKPIPYDLFIASFGRSNYIQTAVQTFDDGISTEVQTEEVTYDNKWTQHPIKFSKNDVCLNFEIGEKNSTKNKQEFNFLFDEDKTETKHDYDYKINNLRIYLEQKNGAGSNKIMSHETYTNKLKCSYPNVNKLAKFLKKAERRISNVLNINTGNAHTSDLKQSSYPFSSGYLTLSIEKVTNDKYPYLKNSHVIGIVFSKTKSNLIFTVHSKITSGVIADKCILCLWDLSVAMIEPIKVLIAIDNVKFSVFYGSIDGFFIGALGDGSIHIWDLTERPTWCKENIGETKTKNFHEVEQRKEANLSETEKDRQWNLKNRDIGMNPDISKATFLTSAFTTSAINIFHQDEGDTIVALEYIAELSNDSDTSSKKILGQLFALQRLGILTVWSVIQEKSKKYVHDPGKAYWSKMILEKRQTVKLSEHIIYETVAKNNIFNLNNVKKRLATRRLQRNLEIEPRQSTSKQFVRPTSAASVNNSNFLVENAFDYKISCHDLKVLHCNSRVYYLIAKNCGEVLCCSRVISAVKVGSFDVGSPASTITSIAVSPHNLPYFVAATDDGIITLCSFDPFRVLLRLDCSNTPTPTDDKYLSDNTIVDISKTLKKDIDLKSIKTVIWSPTDACCITALLDRGVCVWRLTHSDAHAEFVRQPARACVASDKAIALVTPNNEVQVHKLRESRDVRQFQEYVARL